MNGIITWNVWCLPRRRRQWSSHCHHHNHLTALPNLHISSSLFQPSRNNKNKKKKSTTKPDQRLEMVIDVEDIVNRASTSIRRFYSVSESKFNRFVSNGAEAFNDLKTIVTVDTDKRVYISCRRSSLQFISNLFLFGVVIIVAFRVVAPKLGFLVFGGGYGGGFVWRRDRSLAGREVVVEKRRKQTSFNYRVPVNPLSPARGTLVRKPDDSRQRRQRVSTEGRLPKWWPDLRVSSGVSASNPMMNKEEFQKEANRVIRVIMDNRMSGRDITEDDIVHFRRICKISGVRVNIETANTRDSFYRAAVDFLLNSCHSSIGHSTTVQIDGEDARHFVAGLADSIGLENVRAATIVSAAVAARTRAWFLQAWASEMQGKRAETIVELSKICFIHQMFPPDESSPEMEMVARGLEKHLRVEQREHLFNILLGLCGSASRNSAAEALGLISNRLVPQDDSWHPTH